MIPTYPACRDHFGIYPLGELAERCSEKFGSITALQWWNGHGYDGISYWDLSLRVDAIARWLMSQGIMPGDRVGIYAENSPEWGIAYLAIHRAGAVVVPIDRMLPATSAASIMQHAEIRILFSECEYLERLDQVGDSPEIETLVSFNICGKLDVVSFTDAEAEGVERTDDFPTRSLEDLAAILYTSGTTGRSKGVMLSQRNLMSNVAASAQLTNLGPGDAILVLLPMHHALQCTNGFLHPLYIGMTLTFARRLRSAEILADIRDARITVMGSVPLMFEKMHKRMLQTVRQRGVVVGALFKVMMGLARLGEMLGVNLGRIFFASVRRKGGIGSIKYFITGGAAIDPKTSRFFTLLGIPMIQGYGLTETSPVTHFTPLNKIRHGCVGMTVPGVEAKIFDPGEDGVGEICIKGPNVFLGYYLDDAATEEVMDEEGWLHTGDLGIIYSDGFLQITGRKKNVIVTSGGKNVYPEDVEHHLNRCPFIAESLVRPYSLTNGREEVAALVYPDYEELGLRFGEGKVPQGLDLLKFLRGEAKHYLRDLPKYSGVRRFGLAKEEFQKTTTLKVKRFLYSGAFEEYSAAIL